jgi:hypothetical protein
MKRSTFKIIAAVVGLLLIGCADLARKFATSDGLIDFILAISGYEQIDAYPTERVRRERAKSSPLMRERIRAVHLFSVTWANSSAPGWVSTAWPHVDVVVLDSKSRHLQSIATRFFPSTVPNTQRGIRGRSSYFVRLPSMPPPGSTILVAFHEVSIFQCGYPHGHEAAN